MSNVDMEKRTNILALVAQRPERWIPLLKYSRLFNLLRVTSYCRRFVANLRKSRQEREVGPLNSPELIQSLIFWIRSSQVEHFADDISSLSSNQPRTRQSKLHRLAPFLDETGLLRVGGQLQHTILSYDEKHPIVLPKNDHLTTLIVTEAHEKTLHGGVQLSLTYLVRKYWILGVRSLLRSLIHRCLKCFRQWTQSSQMLGNMPKNRINPARQFLHSGLDYAGSIHLRITKGQGHKSYKGFIVVFVCFSTKAVHLKAVSDATTQAFLAAYCRFTARRGLCAELTSDNGTNFRGANNELRALFRSVKLDWKAAADLLANDGTNWKFIPPAAPHFGGLWEAAVKSTKNHIKRIIGDCILIFEELSTLLAQMEECLNSRSICPISSDPLDLSALTLGHFLIGTSVTALPEPNLDDVPSN